MISSSRKVVLANTISQQITQWFILISFLPTILLAATTFAPSVNGESNFFLIYRILGSSETDR